MPYVYRAVGAARVREQGFRCEDGVVRRLDPVRNPAGRVGLFLGALEIRGGLSVQVCWRPEELLLLVNALDNIGMNAPPSRLLPRRAEGGRR